MSEKPLSLDEIVAQIQKNQREIAEELCFRFGLRVCTIEERNYLDSNVVPTFHQQLLTERERQVVEAAMAWANSCEADDPNGLTATKLAHTIMSLNIERRKNPTEIRKLADSIVGLMTHADYQVLKACANLMEYWISF